MVRFGAKKVGESLPFFIVPIPIAIRSGRVIGDRFDLILSLLASRFPLFIKDRNFYVLKSFREIECLKVFYFGDGEGCFKLFVVQAYFFSCLNKYPKKK